MQAWQRLPKRPVLTVALGLATLGLLALPYALTETRSENDAFAFTRCADATVLVGMARDLEPAAKTPFLGIDDPGLLKDVREIFDRATERGRFPKEAGRHWALLFHQLGDTTRAEAALALATEGEDADPGATLLAQLLVDGPDLSGDELARLAAKHESDDGETSLPDWYLLAMHGGDAYLLDWLVERGQRLIRRGAAAHLIAVAACLVSLGCCLWFLLHRDRFPSPAKGRDRLERSWGMWRFFQEWLVAGALALLAAGLLSWPLYAAGAYDLGNIAMWTVAMLLPAGWMLRRLTPGLRHGLAHLLPELRKGNDGIPKRSAAIGFAFGMLGFGGLVLVGLPLHWSGLGSDSLGDAITADLLDRRPGILVGFFAAVVLAPVCEEILFRGFLFGALRSRLGPPFAAVVSSAVFAVLHGYSVAGLAAVFLYGLVFVWLYQRSGSLLPGMVAHAVFNFTVTCQIVGWFSLHD